MGLISCCYESHEYSGKYLYDLTKKHNGIIGATCSVYRKKINNKSIIIKKMSIKSKKYINNEIQILQKLNNNLKHKKMNNLFFPTILDYVYYSNNIFVIMDDTNHYDLFTLIRRTKLDEVSAIHIANQILNALYHLNHAGYSHLDIKPENILVKKIPRSTARSIGVKNDITHLKNYLHSKTNNRVLFNIQLIDFGGSKKYSKKLTELNDFFGTFGYSPPEFFTKKKYNYKSDIWCVGIAIWEMLMGDIPFNDDPISYVFHLKNFNTFNPFKIHKKKIKNINPEIKNILSKMIQPDLDSRVGLDEIFKNDMFSKY